ncbi:MAG: hypothetical protein CMJ29_10140 [Phycisphaerae bacterium]|nr:hypothetical protein [Phycisphaerae bacterium]|tara:strand:+ start:201 stop:536 length:336 start_codon:yes stop_codon:yes gene_type:complete
MSLLSLIMKTNGKGERVFSMSSEEMVIGRSQACDLRIPLPQVSNTHCRISDQGPQQILESLDDEVLTCVNGVQITRTVLQDEDIVQIGPVTFHVSISDGPGGTNFTVHRDD